MAGMLHQALISCLGAIAPPPGDAFAFIINCTFSSFLERHLSGLIDSQVTTYPRALWSFLVACGLLVLQSPYSKKYFDWDPPFSAWRWVTVFYVIVHIFLLVVPLIPPSGDAAPYQILPYWVGHQYLYCCAASLRVFCMTVALCCRLRVLACWGSHLVFTISLPTSMETLQTGSSSVLGRRWNL